MRNFLRGIAVLILLGVLGCGVSCAPPVPSPDEGMQGAFSAELAGELYGVSFCARLEVAVGEEGRRICLEYLSPPALEGLILEKYAGGESVTLTQGEQRLETTSTAVAGWLLPAESLLSVGEEPPLSVERSGEGNYRFALSGERILTVDPEGIPQSLSSPNVSLSVLRFCLE